MCQYEFNMNFLDEINYRNKYLELIRMDYKVYYYGKGIKRINVIDGTF